MIELRPLRQFLVLAEELHFGRAAERLHMTQPPLSLAVQKLEAQLGVPLLERGRRVVALTAAGQALVEAGARLLEQAEQLPARVHAAASGEAGRLSLGFVSTVGYGDMPRWLRQFREAQPDVQLALREATLDVQLRGFESGELDAGFVIHAPGAEPAGFERLIVSTEPLVLAHAGDWGLDRRGGPSLDAVLSQPLVVFPREIAPSLFDALLGFYRAHGATPRIAQEAIQMQTIVNLVSAGMGVAWVPQSVCALQRPGVRYRPWPSAKVPACDTSLIWRPDAAPVVRRFVAHVRGQVHAPRSSATMRR